MSDEMRFERPDGMSDQAWASVKAQAVLHISETLGELREVRARLDGLEQMVRARA